MSHTVTTVTTFGWSPRVEVHPELEADWAALGFGQLSVATKLSGDFVMSRTVTGKVFATQSWGFVPTPELGVHPELRVHPGQGLSS